MDQYAPAPAQLHHDAGGDDPLSDGPRIVVPVAPDPTALAGHDPAARVATLDGLTMGTSWRVRYAAPPGSREATVRALIERRLDDLLAQLSHWLPDSALCRFNRAPAGLWITLPDDLARVVDGALRLAQATRGAFDPALGALVDLCGFGPPGPQPPPTPAAVAAAMARSGYRRLRWDGRRLFQPGGVALDLSGIAKGYAVDAVADTLHDAGIRHCLVEIGGELVGRGMRPDGDPWWVQLEDPPGVTLPPIRTALHQCAVATSGTYCRGAHTLDGRTGTAPDNGVIAVSVLASATMAADALASAATVLYPSTAFLSARSVAARFLIVDAEGIREELTPAMEGLVRA